MDAENIPESAIAVATGDQRELDGIDLFDRSCPIEYVITVEALKEGWDCSFAYVFCSVSRIHSATDVEQLLGRVLRMPYAKRRRAADLNKAYAYLSEPSSGRLRGRWPISSWRWVLRTTRHTTALSRYRKSWAAKPVFWSARQAHARLPAYAHRNTGDCLGLEADTARRPNGA